MSCAGCPLELGSDLPIDFASMTDVVQEQPARLCVDLVKDAVVSNAQPVFWPARQAVMWKGIKPCPHFVNLAQNAFLQL